MKISNEIRVVGGVLGMLLVLLAFLLYDNTNVMRINNDIERDELQITLRQEYERILLGCNTEGARKSDDDWLRELCDEELSLIRNALYGNGR